MERDSRICIIGIGLIGGEIVRQLTALGYSHVISCTHEDLELIDQPSVEHYFAAHRPEHVFFCAVEDGARATETVMRSKQCDGEIIHIGNGTQEIKIIDLLEKVLAIADYRPQVDVQPSPAGCVMRRCPGTGKLWKLTGFQASIPLEQALPPMFEWYMRQFAEMERKSK